MGVHTGIPVQEALNVHLSADLQLTDSLVDLSLGTGQITLNAEIVVDAVLGQGDVDIITGLAVLVLKRTSLF